MDELETKKGNGARCTGGHFVPRGPTKDKNKIIRNVCLRAVESQVDSAHTADIRPVDGIQLFLFSP